MANPLAQAERQRQATRPGLAVRGTFSPARAWRPAVVARLARTLGVKSSLSAPSQEYHPAMQVITGTVVDGRVVVQGAALPEGAQVTVLTRGASEDFTLSTEDEDELLEALAEIDRGEYVSLEQLLDTLPRHS